MFSTLKIPARLNSVVVCVGALALVLPLAVLAVSAPPAKAAADGGPGASPWQQTEQTALRLIAATQTTGDARILKLGLHFKLKPGWKVYWRSPGDAGFPPMPDWSPSENLKTAVLHWPAPSRFEVLGLQSLGYTDEVVLPMTVELVDPAKPLRMAGEVNYLTCQEICIPYTAKLALTLPQGPVQPSPFAHLIGRFQANVPGDGSRHGLAIERAESWTQGKTTLLLVTATAAVPFQAPDLYAEGPPELAFSKPSVDFSNAGRTARLQIEVYGLDALEGPKSETLAGQSLTLTLTDGQRAAERRLTVAAGIGSAAGGAKSLVVILILAVLGGADPQPHALRAAGAVDQAVGRRRPRRRRTPDGAAQLRRLGRRHPLRLRRPRGGADRLEGRRHDRRLGHPVPAALVPDRHDPDGHRLRLQPVGVLRVPPAPLGRRLG